MTLEADLFWSFRSPYSYLATPEYRKLTEDYDLKINVRPVYPIAIRTPDFFKAVNPKWSRVFPRTATIGVHHFYRQPKRVSRN